MHASKVSGAKKLLMGIAAAAFASAMMAAPAFAVDYPSTSGIDTATDTDQTAESTVYVQAAASTTFSVTAPQNIYLAVVPDPEAKDQEFVVPTKSAMKFENLCSLDVQLDSWAVDTTNMKGADNKAMSKTAYESARDASPASILDEAYYLTASADNGNSNFDIAVASTNDANQSYATAKWVVDADEELGITLAGHMYNPTDTTFKDGPAVEKVIWTFALAD